METEGADPRDGPIKKSRVQPWAQEGWLVMVGGQYSQQVGHEEMTSWGHFSWNGTILGSRGCGVWGPPWEGVRSALGALYQGLINSGRLRVSESVPSPRGSMHPSALQEQPALAAHLLRLPVPAAHRLQHAQTHLQDALQGGRPGEWSRAQVCAQAQPLPFPPGLSCPSPKGYRLAGSG